MDKFEIKFNSLEELENRITHIQSLIHTLYEEKKRQEEEITREIERLQAEESILRNLYNYWRGKYSYVEGVKKNMW